MAIHIDDKPLEARLTALGEKQGISTTKTRMALSVIEAALVLCEVSGDPEAWRAAAPPRDSQNNQPANKSVQTDTAPAQQQGSDTQDRDAGPFSPPAGDQDTAAQRPQRPLRSPKNGGADLPSKRETAA